MAVCTRPVLHCCYPPSVLEPRPSLKMPIRPFSASLTVFSRVSACYCWPINRGFNFPSPFRLLPLTLIFSLFDFLKSVLHKLRQIAFRSWRRNFVKGFIFLTRDVPHRTNRTVLSGIPAFMPNSSKTPCRLSREMSEKSKLVMLPSLWMTSSVRGVEISVGVSILSRLISVEQGSSSSRFGIVFNLLIKPAISGRKVYCAII